MSWEIDPPTDELLHQTNMLLAELLAATYNAHFRDANQEPLSYKGADFLPDPDADDMNDAEEAEGDENAAPPLPAGSLGDPFAGKERGHGLVIGHGHKPPPSVLGAFFGKGEGEPEGEGGGEGDQ